MSRRTTPIVTVLVMAVMLASTAAGLRAQSSLDSLEAALGTVRDADSCALLLESISRAHYKEKRYTIALDYATQAEETFAGLHDDIAQARICRLIASVYQRRYKTTEALLWYDKSVDLDLGAGALLSAAHYLRVVGGHWQALSDFVRATESYEKSVRLFEQIGNRWGLVQAYWNIASMHTRKGDFTQSMRYYWRSLALSKEIGNKDLIAQTYWYIGVEYDFQNMKDEGLVYLDSCIALREELGDPRKTGFALMIMGAICTNGGYYDRSMEYLARSMALADSLGDRSAVAENLYSIARIYREQDDMVTAIDYALRSLQLYREIGSPGNEVSKLLKIGTLYSRIGKYDSAEVLYDEALVVMQRLDRPGFQRWYPGEVGQHYARKGSYDTAIAMQRVAMALNDSVYNSETFGSINALTALYEADRRERRITLLAAEKEIDSLKLLQRARGLERNHLLLAQRREERELLTRERRLQQLALDRASDSLHLHEHSIAMELARSMRQKDRLALQSAALGQQKLERTALITGCVLLALFAVLLFRNLRNRRRLLMLRAESSELHAKAIEAQAEAQSAELERREHQQRRHFTGRLLASQEQERKRIAGALHDGIGQDLLIIKHRAMMAMEDTGRKEEFIGDIMHITVEAVEDVRRLCRDLRPYQLERVGLTATLRNMLENIDGSSDMELEWDIGELDGLIAPEREIDLYRVLQEGMNNILKHAEAQMVSVRVQPMDDSIELSLQDDGCGFDPETQQQRVDATGMGLLDMSERMQLLGGSIRISSALGKGTTIEASIPLITVLAAEISSSIEQETTA